MIDNSNREVLSATRSDFAASARAGGEYCEGTEAESAAGQRPPPTPLSEVLPVSTSVFQDWSRLEAKNNSPLKMA
jgi:hypothetical protein